MPRIQQTLYNVVAAADAPTFTSDQKRPPLAPAFLAAPTWAFEWQKELINGTSIIVCILELPHGGWILHK